MIARFVRWLDPRASESEYDDYRYEIKFGAPPTALPELKAWIRSHRAAFRAAHPDRLVNSLYFDSPDWAALDDNLAGIADRTKLRTRWYGDDLGLIDGRLELKCKRNQLGRKVTLPLDPCLGIRDRAWIDILHDLRDRDLGAFTPWLAAAPLPTLVVQYVRSYFVSADGAVRLTVDSDLVTFDQTRTTTPNLARANQASPPALIEIKGDCSTGDAVADIAREIPLRRIAYSKYCTGVLSGLGASGASLHDG